MPVAIDYTSPLASALDFLEQKLAWCTILTKESYCPGALALAKSLGDTSSKYPLVICCTSEITDSSRSKLQSAWSNVIIRSIDPIYPDSLTTTNYAFPHFAETWSKLRCYELDKFDYVGCLDCDMLITNNMDKYLENASTVIQHRSEVKWKGDGIFEKNKIQIMAAHACVCNPMKRPNYPAWWCPSNCVYSQTKSPTKIIDPLSQSDVSPISQLLTFPSLPKSYFNTGLFIISPNSKIFNYILDLIMGLKDLNIYQFPEQDLLNLIYRNHWKALPLSTNFLKTIIFSHPTLFKMNEINNLHFIMDKPWNFRFETKEAKKNPFYIMNCLWLKTYQTISD